MLRANLAISAVLLTGCGTANAASTPATPPTNNATSDGSHVELELKSLDKGQAFNVALDSPAGRAACVLPISYSRTCTLPDIPTGTVVVRVSGDATFDREVQLGEPGYAKLSVGHRSHAFEILSAALFALGAGIVAFAWADSHGFRGSVGDHVGDLLLGIAGVGLGAYGLTGFFVGVLSPHDEIVVEEPGQPPRVVGRAAPTPGLTLRLGW